MRAKARKRRRVSKRKQEKVSGTVFQLRNKGLGVKNNIIACPLSLCMCLNDLCLHPFLHLWSLSTHTPCLHLLIFPQHVTLRRANGKTARRQLDFASREGEVDRATVSACV